jgi:MarR family transcriptional regulator, organic hydroperoxide resistance regulator
MSEPHGNSLKPAQHADSKDTDIERSLERLSASMRRMIKTVRLTEDLEDLTPTQMVVLIHLDEEQTMRIGALAQALAAAQNTVSEVVSRLVRSEMVIKERDPADHRAVIVRLTAKGKAALEKRRHLLKDSHRVLLEAMSVDEQHKFVEAFEILVSMAERARAASPLSRRVARRNK